MSTVLSIAWKTLRARKAAFVGAFVALLGGSAVLTASGVLLESGLRSSVAPERYAGASLVVAADQTLRLPGADFTVRERLPEPVTLDAGTAATIDALAGVDRAIGDYRVAVAVRSTGSTDAPAPASGHGWDSAGLAPYALTDGRAPESDGDVVLDAAVARNAGVGVGDSVDLVVRSAAAPYRVSGTAVPESGETFRRTGAVFFTEQEAGRLSGHAGRFDAVGVLAAPGSDIDALAGSIAEEVAEPVVVHEGSAASQVEFADVGASRGVLLLVAGSFGGMAMLIAMFVVATTLALSIDQRRREFAVLRAIGSTPWQIVRLVAAEALLLSLLGGIAGVVPGFLLAELLRGLFAGLGVVPPDLPMSMGPLPPLAAVLLIVVTAVAGGLVAAVRPARINPVEALRESAVPPADLPRWRRTAGLICLVLGGTAALTPLSVQGAIGAAGTGSAALLLVVAVALLGPVVLRGAVSVCAVPLRWSRVSGFLAAANSESGARRMSAAVTPLVLAIGFTVTMVYSQNVVAAAVQAQSQRAITADFVVADTGSGGVGEEAADAVRAVPGVARATAVATTTVFVPYSVFGDPDLAVYSARGVTSQGLAQTVDLGVVDGDLADLSGRAVALEDSGAGLLGASVGDDVEVRLGDGATETLRLVATYEHGMGFAEMTLPMEVVEGHLGAAPSHLLVRAQDGEASAVEARLAELVQRYPGLTVTDRGAFTAAAGAEAALVAWVNLVGLAMILAYIAIAVVNTLVMATAGRAREFALLRLIGMSRAQVVRTMRLEALLLVTLAALLGTAVAAVPLGVLSLAFLGTLLPAGSPLAYFGVLAVTALLGLVSVLVPVRLALRSRPVDAVGVRE
ncbi:ABC transporter permease [Nocardiopsis ansamitocini]|uniref:ABC transporter permease n=1 Tax=Nocardiopsis ansamitocini TaxID=1670832 RepID=A0A9W6P9B5_9ACTN|nr:ABC transporter permease [Nocardiopsis ansamitocini]GLU49545.1 ABC transporter permease [Nocardiopsis ansamitocini]